MKIDDYMRSFFVQQPSPNMFYTHRARQEIDASMRQLADTGFQPAADFLNSMQSLTNGGAAAAMQDPVLTEYLHAFDGSWRPPQSAGNSLDFVGLVILPRAMDAEVIAWIERYGSHFPPVYAFEAKRRLFRTDLRRALYWHFVGTLRLEADILSCPSTPVDSDLPTIWEPYGASEAQRYAKLDLIKATLPISLTDTLNNWSEVLPSDLSRWQPCSASGQWAETPELRRLRLSHASEKLRSSLVSHR